MSARRADAACLAASLMALSLATAGCTSTAGEQSAGRQSAGRESTPGERGGDQASGPSQPALSAATVSNNLVRTNDRVPVDTVLKLTAQEGRFEAVVVSTGSGKAELRGRLSRGATRWTARERLEPGRRYRVRTVAVDGDGLFTKKTSRFRTEDLTLDEQTFPSIAPLDGETVGVGMPVIISFDVPVTDRANIEQHLSVQTSPRQRGSWAWLSDHEVHWRPQHYWEPGTEVSVDADINSVDAGDGVFGQYSRSASFAIGEAMVSKIDVHRHRMRVFRNGSLLRTIPISAGKAGFTTRSGTKVIMEKHRVKEMDATTIGIDRSDPEYYRIDDVEYAMRVTYSGEFLHAAPWSVGSQGSQNVSHGCVGMSTEDAAWLYDLSRRGDVVEVTGTNRAMEPGNGYTDWNKTFAEYRQESALS